MIDLMNPYVISSFHYFKVYEQDETLSVECVREERSGAQQITFVMAHCCTVKSECSCDNMQFSYVDVSWSKNVFFTMQFTVIVLLNTLVCVYMRFGFKVMHVWVNAEQIACM